MRVHRWRQYHVSATRIAHQSGDQNGGRRARDRDQVGEHGKKRRHRLLSFFTSAPNTCLTGKASGFAGDDDDDEARAHQ